MSLAWRDRLPHAAWLLRLSLGSSGKHPASATSMANLPALLLVCCGVAAADLFGYLPGASAALATFLLILAFPQAAATIHQFDAKGSLDAVRLSGARADQWLSGLVLGVVLPIVLAGAIFLALGTLSSSVDGRLLRFVAILVGAGACGSIVALLAPRSSRSWASYVWLAIAYIGGAIAAVGAIGVEGFQWVRPGMEWPAAILIVEAAIAAMLMPLLLRTLQRPLRPENTSRRHRRWLPWTPLVDRAPALARAMLQAQETAAGTLLVALLVIIAVLLFPWDYRNARLMAASAAAFLPAVVALILVGYESSRDADDRRLQLSRSLPYSPRRAAVHAITGWTLPFAIAVALTTVTVRIAFGSWPLLQLVKWPVEAPIVAVLLATLPAAMAIEGWMSRSRTHMIGVAAVAPMTVVAFAAQRSIAEMMILALLTGWIPWVAAGAALEDPDRPRLPFWPAMAAVVIASAVGLDVFLRTPIVESSGVAGMTALGLLMAAPLLGSREWPYRAWFAGALAVTIGLVLIVTRSYPWGPGLVAIAGLPLAVWQSHRLERWHGEWPTYLRMILLYVVLVGAASVDWFFQRRHVLSPADLTLRVYAITTLITFSAGVLIEIAHVFVTRRLVRPLPGVLR